MFPIGCPNNFWVKVAPCRVCGGVNMLHDESAQQHIVLCSIEELVVI